MQGIYPSVGRVFLIAEKQWKRLSCTARQFRPSFSKCQYIHDLACGLGAPHRLLAYRQSDPLATYTTGVLLPWTRDHIPLAAPLRPWSLLSKFLFYGYFGRHPAALKTDRQLLW